MLLFLFRQILSLSFVRCHSSSKTPLIASKPKRKPFFVPARWYFRHVANASGFGSVAWNFAQWTYANPPTSWNTFSSDVTLPRQLSAVAATWACWHPCKHAWCIVFRWMELRSGWHMVVHACRESTLDSHCFQWTSVTCSKVRRCVSGMEPSEGVVVVVEPRFLWWRTVIAATKM